MRHIFLFLLLFVILATAVHPRAKGAPDGAAKLRALIVDGMNNHDWERGTRILKEHLEKSGRFTVDVSTSPAKDAPEAAWETWRPRFKNYDVVIQNFNGGYKATDRRWPKQVEDDFEAYIRDGGGAVMYHAANNAFREWPAYNQMIGLGWRDPAFGPTLLIDKDEKIVTVPAGEGQKPGHGKEHDFILQTLAPHPITAGFPKKWMHPNEQLTHGQHGPAKDMTILTYAFDKFTNESVPLDWVIPYGKGRVYTTMLGHLWINNGPETAIRSADFITLFTRGAEWAATGKVTQPMPEDFPTETESRVRGAATQPATVPAK